MTVFNDILIPRFKEAFELNYFQAFLVQFAFFGAYFVGSLLYFIISATTGDPIARSIRWARPPARSSAATSSSNTLRARARMARSRSRFRI
jgi:hypothetical protein